MLTTNKDLMAQARARLKGNWGPCIAVTAIYIGIVMMPNLIPFGLGGIANLVIGGALALGLAIYFLTFARTGTPPAVSVMFDGFKHFGNALATYLLMVLFILLWMLLLIVPGVIAALGYAMTFYILADNPAMPPMEALGASKSMMMGNKWKFFCLGCRFIGWALLGILSLGIGFLWISPYMYTSMAGFYLDLKQNQGAQPVATPVAGA